MNSEAKIPVGTVYELAVMKPIRDVEVSVGELSRAFQEGLPPFESIEESLRDSLIPRLQRIDFTTLSDEDMSALEDEMDELIRASMATLFMQYIVQMTYVIKKKNEGVVEKFYDLSDYYVMNNSVTDLIQLINGQDATDIFADMMNDMHGDSIDALIDKIMDTVMNGDTE